MLVACLSAEAAICRCSSPLDCNTQMVGLDEISISPPVRSGCKTENWQVSTTSLGGRASSNEETLWNLGIHVKCVVNAVCCKGGWCLQVFGLVSRFVSLFLVERIMQQPILVPLQFWFQLNGFSWLEPMGDRICVLDVMFQHLLNAVLDDFCSGGDPICKFIG